MLAKSRAKYYKCRLSVFDDINYTSNVFILLQTQINQIFQVSKTVKRHQKSRKPKMIRKIEKPNN